MGKVMKLNIEIDLDEVKKHVQEYAGGGDLESSGGIVPDDLDRSWDDMSMYFPDSLKPLNNVVCELISILREVHDAGEE